MIAIDQGGVKRRSVTQRPHRLVTFRDLNVREIGEVNLIAIVPM